MTARTRVLYCFTALPIYVNGFFASDLKGHSRKFRMVPDSFVCVWTIEQRNVVRRFGISADIDGRRPVAQKTVRRRAALRAISKRPKQRKAQPARHGDRVEGPDRGTGEIKWTATRAWTWSSVSNLSSGPSRKFYASADSKEIFVKDFAAAWNKTMNLDRYDLHKA